MRISGESAEPVANMCFHLLLFSVRATARPMKSQRDTFRAVCARECALTPSGQQVALVRRRGARFLENRRERKNQVEKDLRFYLLLF